MARTPVQAVFQPENEPYLGRELLFQFDQLIISAMGTNAEIAPRSHGVQLTDHQTMACQVIAQALSITLSIRELVRQGYLFGAHVLLRPLVERAAILLYLHYRPKEIEKWNQGWHTKHGAPNLSKMLDAIQKDQQRNQFTQGHNLTEAMNSLLHAKPSSVSWDLITLGENGIGHAVSKILNRPELCDELCANVIPWLVIIMAMMPAYFPDKPGN